MNHPTPTIHGNNDHEEMTDKTESDENEEKTARRAVDVMEDSQDLYERKNADYGDSWKLVGKTFALWCEHHGVDELTIKANSFEMNAFGLFTRRLDKMLREFNGWFLADEMQVSESIAETHEDDVPYSAMHTQLAEEYATADPEEILP